MARRGDWHYQGDMNIEHGGFFYNLKTYADGYVDYVSVEPFSDAGGQDNGFWIETGSVTIPFDERLEEALASFCLREEYLRTTDDKARWHMAVGCCFDYGLRDRESCESIQIGPDDPFHKGEYIPYDRRVRDGVDLHSWVKRHYGIYAKGV